MLLRRSVRAIQFVDGVSGHDLDQTVSASTWADTTFDLVLSCGGKAVSSVREGTFDSDYRETVSCFTVRSPLFARCLEPQHAANFSTAR